MATEPLVDAVNEIEKAKVLLGCPIDVKVDALRTVGMHELANYFENIIRQVNNFLDNAELFINQDTDRQVNASLDEISRVFEAASKL